jgi:hypothetical protein
MNERFVRIAVGLVKEILKAAAAAQAKGGHPGFGGLGWAPGAAGDLVGHWRASLAGALFTSYQVDLVMNGNGTYVSRMTKLNGREPAWSSGTQGRYRVERLAPASFEYAKAWIVSLEPGEPAEGPAPATEVMRVHGLPVEATVAARLQYSPANVGGNVLGPTLTYDGPAGTTGFGLARVPGR